MKRSNFSFVFIAIVLFAPSSLYSSLLDLEKTIIHESLLEACEQESVLLTEKSFCDNTNNTSILFKKYKINTVGFPEEGNYHEYALTKCFSSNDDVVEIYKKFKAFDFLCFCNLKEKLLKKHPWLEITQLNEAILKNDAESQAALAFYCFRKNYPEAKAEAQRLWLLAAEQGHTESQSNLGFLYDEQNNQAEAEMWYKKAAEQNCATAQNSLGLLYQEQKNNPTEVEMWFKKAAEQNHVAAQNNLGSFYYKRRNFIEAERWLGMAAEQNYATAQNSLGCFYYRHGGYFTKAEMWFKKAAEQNYAAAQNNLGSFYYKKGNFTEAKIWFKKAARQNYVAAQNSLSLLYEEQNNVAKANMWSRKAKENLDKQKLQIRLKRSLDDNNNDSENTERGVKMRL